jgi:hypothetical protein
VSSVKIGTEKGVLYLSVQVKLCPYFNFSSDSVKIRCSGSLLKATQFVCFVKVVQSKAYFT